MMTSEFALCYVKMKISPVKGPRMSDENTHTFLEKELPRLVNKITKTPTTLNKY